MGSMQTEIDHTTDERGGRYHLRVDGDEVGELEHVDRDGVRTFTHTGVRRSHEGRGLAAALVRRGLDDARSDGMRVIGRCPYVAAYLDDHPDYDDLRA